MTENLLDIAGLPPPLRKSRSQLRKNARSGKMPASVKIGGRIAWLQSEIDAYIKTEIIRRDYPMLADDLSTWLRKQSAQGQNPWSVERVDGWLEKRLDSGKKGKE